MRTKSVAILLTALSLAACGDSNTPALITLTEAQAEDMMDALATAGAFDAGAGLSIASAAHARNAAVVAAAITSTVNATAPCPNGGTAGVNGSTTINDLGTQITTSVTQTFSGCQATSSTGTLWTFNGAPSIVSTFSMSYNPTSGAFTMTGTQSGALDVSGPDGSGRCAISLSLSASGNENNDVFSVSLTGTVCGISVDYAVEGT